MKDTNISNGSEQEHNGALPSLTPDSALEHHQNLVESTIALQSTLNAISSHASNIIRLTDPSTGKVPEMQDVGFDGVGDLVHDMNEISLLYRHGTNLLDEFTKLEEMVLIEYNRIPKAQRLIARGFRSINDRLGAEIFPTTPTMRILAAVEGASRFHEQVDKTYTTILNYFDQLYNSGGINEDEIIAAIVRIGKTNRRQLVEVEFNELKKLHDFTSNPGERIVKLIDDIYRKHY